MLEPVIENSDSAFHMSLILGGSVLVVLLVVIGFSIYWLAKKLKRKSSMVVVIDEGDAARIEAAYQDFVNRKVGLGEYANRMYSEKDAFKMAARKFLSE
jgi:hypothetical protein